MDKVLNEEKFSRLQSVLFAIKTSTFFDAESVREQSLITLRLRLPRLHSRAAVSVTVDYLSTPVSCSVREMLAGTAVHAMAHRAGLTSSRTKSMPVVLQCAVCSIDGFYLPQRNYRNIKTSSTWGSERRGRRVPTRTTNFIRIGHHRHSAQVALIYISPLGFGRSLFLFLLISSVCHVARPYPSEAIGWRCIRHGGECTT